MLGRGYYGPPCICLFVWDKVVPANKIRTCKDLKSKDYECFSVTSYHGCKKATEIIYRNNHDEDEKVEYSAAILNAQYTTQFPLGCFLIQKTHLRLGDVTCIFFFFHFLLFTGNAW